MRINIKATNITLNDAIFEYIEKKIGFLEKFSRDFLPGEKDLKNPIEARKGRMEIFVDVGRESSGANKGLFFSKAQIDLPGKQLIVAKTRSSDLREAIDELKDDLYSQLISAKEKTASVTERKVREAKKDLKIDEGARFYRKGRIRDERI